MRSRWTQWTTPTTADGIAARREAVLLTVLAAMVLLAAVTVLLQTASLLAGDDNVAGWIPVVVLVGVAFYALLRAARAGHRRAAAVTLVVLFGALTVMLLLTDGADHPMWAMLSAFTLALAAILLGGRGGLVALGVGAVVVLPIVVLQDKGPLRPLLPDQAEASNEIVTAVEMLILLGVLVAIFRVYTRDVLLAVDAPARPRARTGALTPREVQVVRLIADGHANDAIAERLVVSPRTVHSHVASAMRKCGCSNRTELGVLAVREGLAPLEAPTPAS